MDINLIKIITDMGILVTIAAVYIKQQQKLFAQQEEVIRVLTKLEKYLNNSYLHGKALEIAVILKVKEFRWRVEKKVIVYIENNHLQQNWEIITKEFDNYLKSKLNDFENQMSDIIEDTVFKVVFDIFKTETVETQKTMIAILSDLKENGEKTDYESAKRVVKAHMELVQNEMIAKIKEIVG